MTTHKDMEAFTDAQVDILFDVLGGSQIHDDTFEMAAQLLFKGNVPVEENSNGYFTEEAMDAIYRMQTDLLVKILGRVIDKVRMPWGALVDPDPNDDPYANVTETWVYDVPEEQNLFECPKHGEAHIKDAGDSPSMYHGRDHWLELACGCTITWDPFTGRAYANDTKK